MIHKCRVRTLARLAPFVEHAYKFCICDLIPVAEVLHLLLLLLLHLQLVPPLFQSMVPLRMPSTDFVLTLCGQRLL